MPQEEMLALFEAQFPKTHQAAIATAIIAACRSTAAHVKARYRPDYHIGPVLGQDRYHDIQNALLDLTLDGVTMQSERHPHGSTYYTSLETPAYGSRLARLEARSQVPAPTLFRMYEHGRQLAFNFAKVVAEIQIVFDPGAIEEPQYIDIRFPDGHGDYAEGFVDLMTTLREPVPVEIVADKRDVQPRQKEAYCSKRRTHQRMKNASASFARIAEAREARAMSLEDLASIVGTSKQLLHKYETGKAHPGPETAARIATALELPLAFFMRPGIQPALRPLFFRDFRSKTRPKHRLAAVRQMAWAQHLVDVLDVHVIMPEINIPDFHPPSDPREIQPTQIEQAATALRRHWGLGDGVISDVVRLAESHGIVVITQLVRCDTIDGFSQWSGSGRPFIVINCRDVSPSHQRLDVAHEIGHLVLHRAVDKRFVEANPETHKIIEQQAFDFGSAFLMPELTFRRSVPLVSLDALLMLKPQWKASVAAMLRRSERLGMVPQDQAKRLWINRNRRGWREREPFEDQVPFEHPRVLANAIAALRESSPGRLDELVEELALSPADIARLSGIAADEFRRRARPRRHREASSGASLKTRRARVRNGCNRTLTSIVMGSRRWPMFIRKLPSSANNGFRGRRRCKCRTRGSYRRG